MLKLPNNSIKQLVHLIHQLLNKLGCCCSLQLPEWPSILLQFVAFTASPSFSSTALSTSLHRSKIP
ncbi:hypothetical protein WN943_006707 [Citrus x changshan-huyou]